jgi:release factor glutamine methyltransferase
MQKQILIAKLFNFDLVDVALGNFELNDQQKIKLEESLNKFYQGVPIDYIVGKIKILNLILKVTPKTLIPREETEFWIQKYKLIESTKTSTLIDVGTGTGLIGLYLSDVYKQVYLLDIDPETIQVTKFNIAQNKIKNCKVLLSDGLQALSLEDIGPWDLVANLPYVPLCDLSDSVEYNVSYEPQIAIYSGEDGLDLYSQVLQQINNINNKPQIAAFELDPRNIEFAEKELQKFGYKTEIWKDQNSLKRVLLGFRI